MSQRENEKLLSQSELGRLLNIPHTKLQRLIKAGRIVPDFSTDRYRFFKPSTAERLKREEL